VDRPTSIPDTAANLEQDGVLTLRPGDLLVVPRGTRHRPIAERPAHTLLLEKPETEPYGDAAG
jgi:ribosomal protein L16 Arg81 hydroxylase